MSDLRESGAIEQDADIITFIHRPEYYGIMQDEQGDDLRGIAEIIVAKHRNGAIGDVRLRFRAEQAKFENMSDSQINEVIAATLGSRMNSDVLPPMDIPSGGFGNDGGFSVDSGIGAGDAPF
jgi:replicative DNA helicase